MKKVAIYMMMLAGLGFTACGGAEGEAKALGEKKCACKKLEKEGKEDDFKKCRDDYKKTEHEFFKKYEDKKDDKAFGEKLKSAFDGAYEACMK
ncbi:MAG: hypothetical protein KF690_11145 [Bacteroidetes bacterium]|nr:hypothetical protein [Bacteroidota bacterium]